MTANTEPEFNMIEVLRLHAETLGKTGKPASRQLLIDAAERIEELEKQIAQPSPLTIPLDEETRWILGRPNFACGRTAKELRDRGHSIEHKSDAEQAAVIHWMLNLYLKHGEKWTDAADEEMKSCKATSP